MGKNRILIQLANAQYDALLNIPIVEQRISLVDAIIDSLKSDRFGCGGFAVFGFLWAVLTNGAESSLIIWFVGLVGIGLIVAGYAQAIAVHKIHRKRLERISKRYFELLEN